MFLFQFASHLDWTNEPHLNLTMRKAPSYVVICSFIWRKVRIWSELMSMMKTQTGPSAMHAFIAKEGNNKWFKWFKQGREIPTCFSFSSNEAHKKTQDALFSYWSSVIQTTVILYSCVVGVLNSPGGGGGGGGFRAVKCRCVQAKVTQKWSGWLILGVWDRRAHKTDDYPGRTRLLPGSSHLSSQRYTLDLRCGWRPRCAGQNFVFKNVNITKRGELENVPCCPSFVFSVEIPE